MSMILHRYYQKLFPIYETELEKAIGNVKTVLDVGCGSNSPLRNVSKQFRSVGVDIFQPSIEASKKQNIHDEYHQLDILKLDTVFSPGSFDCVLASDVIEHLDKEDGMKLLTMMEQIAKKRMIIFTPNGFTTQEAVDGNPWQEHKSGWTPQEMRKLGYAVMGIYGWKHLRGELSLVKYKPRKLWTFISDFTQLITKYVPTSAFALLCVKEKK